MRRNRHFIVLCLGVLTAASCFARIAVAEEKVPQLPQFYVNDQPVSLTVQDLSGLGTRPLRLLIQRNNKFRGEDWIQVNALGASEGDSLRIAFAAPVPGMRVTLYKILSVRKGLRYLSMPASVYFSEPGEEVYEETIEPFHEEFFIIVFEKTDSPEEKDVNVSYFEERVRDLVIDSYKTNWRLSSLKLRMRDFANAQALQFYERDAQVLIDRLIDPRRMFLVRIWKAGKA